MSPESRSRRRHHHRRPSRRHPHPSRRLAVVLALPALLVGAAPAAADAPWSAPTSVAPGVRWNFGTAVSPDGAAVVFGGDESHLRLFPLSPAGVPGPARRAPNVERIAAAGDRVAYLRRARPRGAQGVSFGDFGARSLGRLHVLARRGEDLWGPIVGGGGHVLVVAESRPASERPEFSPARYRLSWSAPRGGTRWVSRRLPGRASLLGIAVDRRGVATMLLQRAVEGTARYRITARVLDLGTGELAPERTLDRTPLELVDGSVAVDDRGGAVIAWGMQDGGEEVNDPYVVRAAFRRRGTTAFTPRVTLDPGRTRHRPDGSPVAAMTPRGQGTVAWTQPVGRRSIEGTGPNVPQAVTATPHGRFGRATQLLPQGAVSTVEAVGETTLVSVTGTPEPFDASAPDEQPPATVAGAVVRRGAGPFGAFEPVASSTPGDAGRIGLAAGPAGVIALWIGASAPQRPALRRSVRPVG